MKHKHLSLENRETIEDMLKNNFNFTQIGNHINKHRTSISKEILNHRFRKDSGQYNSYFAKCIHNASCENFGTKLCNRSCQNFNEMQCSLLQRPPYVCNGCPKKSHCRFSKFYYRAKDANNEYRLFRSES